MSAINSKLVIKGVNRKGEVFRPSDWAQRLSSIGAEFGPDHRLHFSPLLHPDITNGVVCLVVDPNLEKERPDVFRHVMNFAETNDLVTQLDEVA